MTTDDGRWSQQLLLWEPGRRDNHHTRSQGRPKKRWTDDINKFWVSEFGLQHNTFYDIAVNWETWANHEQANVDFMTEKIYENSP